MASDDIHNSISAIAAKGTAFFAGLGLRLLVHFASLAAAAIVCASLPAPLSGARSAFMAIAAYIGFICLIPKGIRLNATWLVPSGAGILLCLLWTVWGVPWQFTLLWGGLLTWTIRLLANKGDIGWEWSAAPWILIALYGFFTRLMPLTHTALPFWLFPPLALGGWGTLLLHARLSYVSGYRKMLVAACMRMDDLLSTGNLPNSLVKPLHLLREQGRDFERMLSHMDKASLTLIANIDAIARKLPHSGAVTPWNTETERLRDEINRLNTQLKDSIRTCTARKQPLDSGLAIRLEALRAEAQALNSKKYVLPPDMQEHIHSIAESTESILDQLRASPQESRATEIFFARYLPAAHTVVDEYARLSEQQSEYDKTATTMARSRELLERLEKAFTDEHSRLVQKGAINFTAELNLLDKLLKMEGR